jgi:hypothetical protein
LPAAWRRRFTIDRESAMFASSGDHVSSVSVDLNSAIVAGCRDGRRPAGEIVPQLPCKRDGAIAHHARLPVGTLPPESLTPRCDPLLPGAGAKAAAPCRLHVCCFAPTRRSEPKD